MGTCNSDYIKSFIMSLFTNNNDTKKKKKKKKKTQMYGLHKT